MHSGIMPVDKFKIIVVAVLVFTIAAIVVVTGYHYRAPAVPRALMVQIEPGMHMDAVEAILGPPDWKEPNPLNKTEIWTYGRFFRKHILEIAFTSGHAVRYVYHGYGTSANERK